MGIMRSILSAILLFLLPAIVPPFLYAELPPSAYEAMQAAAPEYLDVEFLRVEVVPSWRAGVQDVIVLARVDKVHRSVSGLTSGAMIHIIYKATERVSGEAGPVPVVREGEASVAYLNPSAKPEEFAPAAGAMTFRKF